jgi:hypothetical protein
MFITLLPQGPYQSRDSTALLLVRAPRKHDVAVHNYVCVSCMMTLYLSWLEAASRQQ